MSTPRVVITGASSGIGAACAVSFAEVGHPVCLIARRGERLRALQQAILAEHPSAEVELIVADLSTDEGVEESLKALKGRPIACLIHNAATIQPISSLLTISREAWRSHMRLNVEAPLWLTQGLVQELKGGRVLQISSGAAHRAIGGWGAYCVSKGALFRLWDNLKGELWEHNVALASVRPGVVDTEMQAEIRASDDPSFTQRPYFESLKDNALLSSPKEVADYLRWLYAEVSAEELISREWDIRDER